MDDIKKLVDDARDEFKIIMSKARTLNDVQFKINAMQAVMITFYKERMKNFDIDMILKTNDEHIQFLFDGMMDQDKKENNHTKH